MLYDRTCLVNMVNSCNQRVQIWATTLKVLSALGMAL